jgi:2'-5' RNA ligase
VLNVASLPRVPERGKIRRMHDGCNGDQVRINSFALVSYCSGPLADYLTRLRSDLVPDCEAKAHLTVLPPRPIHDSAEHAMHELMEGLQDFGPVLVELGDVATFPESRVIYVSVKSGHEELERMHDALNTGSVAFEEPFPYHPHITLAQDLPIESIGPVLDRARRHWTSWPHPRSFMVERLTFVQNTFENRWCDLEDVQLVARVAS